MSVPRTKPWEVSSGTSSATVSGGEASAPAVPASTTAPTAIPDRPTSLTSEFDSGYGSNTGYGANTLSYGTGGRYGSGMYGGGGLGSSMYGGGYGSSMYGGGYGSSMYGGGFGSSMYGGGYGSGMYGSGMYGGGMYGNGMMNGGAGPLGEGTQATFQLIESIIGAVGGFAQMLEATYMATHSSFFTMVSLAEQFGNLKNALGSLLGIFALIKFVKKIFYKITGTDYNNGLNFKEFAKFENKQKKLEDNIRKQQNPNSRPRISLKPLLLFLAASIGFPYLLSKAIQKLNEQQQQRRIREQQSQFNQQQQTPGNPLNPSNLQFAKALYEFNPENPNIEIELKPNELVAILSKLDPLGNESKWWKVRSRSGKVGYVPSNYLSVIERKAPQQAIEPVSSTANQPSQDPNLQQLGSVEKGKSAFDVGEFQKLQN